MYCGLYSWLYGSVKGELRVVCASRFSKIFACCLWTIYCSWWTTLHTIWSRLLVSRSFSYYRSSCSSAGLQHWYRQVLRMEKLRSYRELWKALAEHLAKRQPSTMSPISQSSITGTLSGSHKSGSSSEQVRCPPRSQHDENDQKQIDVEPCNYVYNMGWHKQASGRIPARQGDKTRVVNHNKNIPPVLEQAADNKELIKDLSSDHGPTSRNHTKRSRCGSPNTGQCYDTRKKTRNKTYEHDIDSAQSIYRYFTTSISTANNEEEGTSYGLQSKIEYKNKSWIWRIKATTRPFYAECKYQ